MLATRAYLGLGVSNPAGDPSILASFQNEIMDPLSWFWKLLLTAITLGMGFKGGEVTPLFFIGAALGHTLAVFGHAPVNLMAACGFLAVFAGATNTPVASIIMGMELFGAEHVLYFSIACFMAYLFSGRQGIYPSQSGFNSPSGGNFSHS